jgi:hypothetical protein
MWVSIQIQTAPNRDGASPPARRTKYEKGVVQSAVHPLLWVVKKHTPPPPLSSPGSLSRHHQVATSTRQPPYTRRLKRERRQKKATRPNRPTIDTTTTGYRSATSRWSAVGRRSSFLLGAAVVCLQANLAVAGFLDLGYLRLSLGLSLQAAARTNACMWPLFLPYRRAPPPRLLLWTHTHTHTHHLALCRLSPLFTLNNAQAGGTMTRGPVSDEQQQRLGRRARGAGASAVVVLALALGKCRGPHHRHVVYTRASAPTTDVACPPKQGWPAAAASNLGQCMPSCYHHHHHHHQL